MTIQMTSEGIAAGIKVFSIDSTNIDPNDVAGSSKYNNVLSQYNVDLSAPANKCTFMCQIIGTDPTATNPATNVILATIQTTAEWILALVQDVMNDIMAKNNSPQVPITGQWDCNTQQDMAIMSAGATGKQAVSGGVGDFGPDEFTYLLTQSTVLAQLIEQATLSQYGSPTKFIALAPIQGVTLPGLANVKFVGLKADPKCAGAAITCPTGQKWDSASGKCVDSGVAPVTETQCPTGQQWDATQGKCVTTSPAKSYFWPIVGGLTAGVVVIGGGYYLMKGDKSKAETSS